MNPPDRKPIVESLQDLVVAVSQLVHAVAATATSARQIVEPLRVASSRRKAAKKAKAKQAKATQKATAARKTRKAAGRGSRGG